MVIINEDFILKNDGSEPLFIQSWQENKRRIIKPILQWQNPEHVPCRIGLIGSDIAAKAQVAKWLADEIDIPIIRNVTKTVDRVPEIQTLLERYSSIYLAQLYEEMKCGDFITDYTTMDLLANIWYDIDRKKLAASMLTNILANFTSTITSSQYSAVFYFEPTKSKKSIALDKYIRRILDNFMIDYLPLIGDNVIKTKIAINYLESLNMIDDDEDNE